MNFNLSKLPENSFKKLLIISAVIFLMGCEKTNIENTEPTKSTTEIEEVNTEKDIEEKTIETKLNNFNLDKGTLEDMGYKQTSPNTFERDKITLLFANDTLITDIQEYHLEITRFDDTYITAKYSTEEGETHEVLLRTNSREQYPEFWILLEEGNPIGSFIEDTGGQFDGPPMPQ